MAFSAVKTNKHVSAEQWAQVIQAKAGFPEPGIRGLLLERISAGVEEFWKRYAATIPHLRPALGVPLSPLPVELADYERKIFYSHDNRSIIAARGFLDWTNALPLDRGVLVRGHANEVCFRGKLLQYCFLSGVEGADHALRRQERDTVVHKEPGQHKNLASFDAHPVEFRALKRQLEIAIDLRYPDVTIAILRQRIANAEGVREILTDNAS